MSPPRLESPPARPRAPSPPSPPAEAGARRAAFARRLVVSAALLVAVLAFVPWRQLWGEVRELRPQLWLGIFAGLLAGHAAGVLKWRLILNLGRARLRVGDAAQCYGAGLFANLFLPSIVGGDALKALLAGRATRRLEAAVVGGLTERLIDTAALLSLILIGAWSVHVALPGWAQPVVQVGVLVAAGFGVLALPLLLRMRIAAWPRKLRRRVGRAMVALRRLGRRPLLALGVLALSLSIQSWFVLLNAWLGRGIGIELPLALWFFAVPMTKAVTLAPISLGGFGLREVTLAGILLVLAGVPESEGVAASILWQTQVVGLSLTGGLVWLALGLRRSAVLRAEPGALRDATVRAERSALPGAVDA